jgi:hypothetical protein
MQDFNLKAAIAVNSAFAVSSRNPRTPSNGNALRWHLRMGHPGPEALANLANCSDGVRLKGGPTLTQCDSYRISKITR